MKRMPLTKVLDIIAADKAAERQAAISAEAKKVKDVATSDAKKVKGVATSDAKKVKDVATSDAKKVKDVATSDAKKVKGVAMSGGMAEAIRAGVATSEVVAGEEKVVPVRQLFCYRCGYVWWQKPPGLRLPTRCAGCISPLWNKPRGKSKSS